MCGGMLLSRFDIEIISAPFLNFSDSVSFWHSPKFLIHFVSNNIIDKTRDDGNKDVKKMDTWYQDNIAHSVSVEESIRAYQAFLPYRIPSGCDRIKD